MKQTKNEGWTVVAECVNVAEASIIAGAIENEGIPTAILNSALQSALPLTYTWAPVQVVVPPAMADEAREIVPPDSRV